MLAFIKALVALAKVIPMLDKYYNDFVNAYVDLKVSRIESGMIDGKDKRALLLKSIQSAETNEEIITFSIILDDYNSGRMREQNTDGILSKTSI